MSELSVKMLKDDMEIRRTPSDGAMIRYTLDQKFNNGEWYLWLWDNLIGSGQFDKMLEKLRLLQGNADEFEEWVGQMPPAQWVYADSDTWEQNMKAWLRRMPRR